MVKDTKYAVVKREDLQWRPAGKTTQEQFATITEKLIIEDAVVIRRQDAFAAPALHAYANAIGVAIRAMKTVQPMHPEVYELELKRLQQVADYFHEQAELASDHTRGNKLPD